MAEGSPEACRTSDYFDAATLGGAEALGRPDLSRLVPGCRADLAVFDLGLPNQHQAIDPVETPLLTGRGGDARTVVDSCFAMEDRVIPGVDEAAVTAKAQAQFDRLVARVPRSDVAASADRRDLPAKLPGLGLMLRARTLSRSLQRRSLNK